ncbi:MAG: 3-oxoacyl-ACP reductase FabG [Thiobacillus sp.]|uniref:3-oxoacyl-ACP reductase FabG n=1 Tax=unclassified Thiobacillus TaxID=2646513 RepID=UPI00095B9A1A|nr:MULTISPECIES: 3-oxoacyl-ACP reductase FabG [unclassified Thiobacillus]MBN8770037.1 3-oxoacyl-ACP reductase FabG [Thiobacillus sp.]MBN8780631.1 3-oxoacyl-ACP reductase FabG [Thiobacillus sp.]OJY57807.1 MAG: 3-oxoacyl-ACP reductase [Thiobacillus sp. 0-1251]
MLQGRLAHGANLEGQVALVTGASRGIGQAIALALGQAGATVIGTATSDKGARAISDYLAAASIKGSGMKLNVTDAAEVDAVIAAIEKNFGAIGILVNNAGITRDNLLMRMKDEEWDDILATNLTSVFRLSRAVLRAMMKARAGRIISIASVVGAMGNAGQTNYSAAKAGIMGFTKSLAREVGSRNITVNCVAPGFIDTDMTRALPDAQREALLAHIPLGRLGAAEDIAQAVAFLASPAAGYISGTTLHVNGGMYMA